MYLDDGGKMRIVTSKFISQVIEDSILPLPLICENVFLLDSLIYNQLTEREKYFMATKIRQLE